MYKPYFVIDFSAVNCLIDIRINDVSVLSMNVDGQISTKLPVNNAITESGQQQVSYFILPLMGETSLHKDAKFLASVCLYDAGEDLIKMKKEINKFELPDNKAGIPLPSFKYEDSFSADVPYRLFTWKNSQNLSEIGNLRKLVDSSYKDIEKIINNAQYKQFANLIQKREDNITTSMYLSEIEKKERVSELIDIIETGFKIMPVSEKDIMVIYGYDKLVTLRKQDGNSALLLKNSNTGEELNLEIQFHLEQGKTELSII